MEDEKKSICRVCLTDCTHCTSMYESHNNTKYCELIVEYIGLEMQQKDNLPSVICDSCSSELMIVVNFVSKCRESNEKLKEALENDVPFYNLISTDIKEEDNIPLSILYTTAIKEENVDTVEADDFINDEFYPTYSKDDKNIKNEPKKRKIKNGKSLMNKLFSAYSEDDKKESKEKKIENKNNLIMKDFKCKICGLKTNSRAALITHNRIHTGERPFLCPHCDKSFSQKGTLKEHIGRRHSRNDLSQRNCICDVCGKRCYRKTDLKVHMRIHTKEKPYKCQHCSQSFAQIGTLSQHTKLHTGDRPFSCHICGKSFITHTSLRKHLFVHTPEKKYKCHLCEKALKSRCSLNKHLQLHTSEKPFSCEICGAAFAQKGNLKNHVVAKHSERSGNCEICRKTFSNIIIHNRIHSGDRPFNCFICEKKFLHQRFLSTHLKRHREATKYACTKKNCDAAFPMQRQLDFHIMKSHSSFFPFVCKLCSKGYYRLSDLKKHKNSSNCKDDTMKEISLKVD